MIKLMNYVINQIKKSLTFVRKKIPVICFPKGIKENYKTFTDIVRPNGISIDYDVNPNWAKENLKDVCIQGGLDPKILFERGKLFNVKG